MKYDYIYNIECYFQYKWTPWFMFLSLQHAGHFMANYRKEGKDHKYRIVLSQ